MAVNRISYTIAYGAINKDLRVDFIYQPDMNPDSKYQTVRFNPETGNARIRQSHALSISEGFDRNRMFIPGAHVDSFMEVFCKTVELISKKLLVLFPNINNIEQNIDQQELEKFTRNDAIMVNGYSALPCTYVTMENETRPGIRIENTKGELVRMALTDAIIVSKVLQKMNFPMFDLMLFMISQQN